MSKIWTALFRRERAGGPELLLLVLLFKTFRDGLVASVESADHFYAAAAFDSYVVAVDPVGWAAWLPARLVLSLTFNHLLGAIVAIASLCWATKYMLPHSAIIATLAIGLLASVRKSSEFNYIHEDLPTTACLIAFAAAYTLCHRDFLKALNGRRFWTHRLYPRWVTLLIFTYMGTYYTYSGLSKLLIGGWKAGSGVTLQLITHGAKGSPFADVILNSRELATILMVLTIIFETGAIAAFFVRGLRWLWCAGLIGMHTSVLLVLSIPFKVNILILVWMAVPRDRWALRVRIALRKRKLALKIYVCDLGSIQQFLVDRLYAVDPLGVLWVMQDRSTNNVALIHCSP